MKLFVLTQLRAISTKIERITTQLLRQVYEDELKPVHPMMAALRSGDPELISQYSDLTIPDIDQKILLLSSKIDEVNAKGRDQPNFNNNEQAIRLYHLLLALDCNSDLVIPLIEP